MNWTDDLKPVYVEWVDSCSSMGWQSEWDVVEDPMECVTMGFLVKENDLVITVALSATDKARSSLPYADFMTIPKVAITSMYYLTL